MREINKIGIIGGGTASLLTASLLAHNVSGMDIDIIYPDDDSIIGVGEATLLSFAAFMENCGFSEEDWMDKVDATYKCGIKYKNWRKDGAEVYHPFGTSLVRDDTAGLHVQTMYNTDTGINFVNNNITSNPLYYVNQGLTALYDRAYHLDTFKLCSFLRNHLSSYKNINIINAKVDKVVGTDQVESIYLSTGETKKYDLYIDGSGFSSVFSNIGTSDFVDMSEYITANAAIAFHMAYVDKEKEMFAYTQPEAVDHGWVWTIPLQSRIGMGLVYNNDVTSKEEALRYIKNRYGSRIISDLNHIEFTPGFNRTSWRKNVVSIGLNAGFIEPLESSGIAFFQDSAKLIYFITAKGGYSQNDIDYFNISMFQKYEETLAYVQGHYTDFTCWRNTPFWDLAKTKKRTAVLSTALRNFDKTKLNTQLGAPGIFGNHSWGILFAGFFNYFSNRNPHNNKMLYEPELGYSNYNIINNKELRNVRYEPKTDNTI